MTGELVDTETGELVKACSAEEARELTDRIKTGVETLWHLIKQAYVERAWEALGYVSWDDYCTREFGTQRLGLPREERREVVGSLWDAGLTTRAIAAATGTNRETVRQEVSGDKKLPPECATETEDDAPPPEPAPRLGRDGKRYPTPKPKVQGERDPELTEAEQRERDKQQAIQREKGRLEGLVNGWVTLRSLPDNAWRDEILDSLVGPDRDKVVEIEGIYLRGVGRE